MSKRSSDRGLVKSLASLAICKYLPQENASNPSFVAQSGRLAELVQPSERAAHMVSDAGNSELTGRRLGAYQVQARLGTGGMGEVYRARDTKLGRDVAIKILPGAFTNEPGRLKRFER